MDQFSNFKPIGRLWLMAATPSPNPPATRIGAGLNGDITYRFTNTAVAGSNAISDCVISFGKDSTSVSANASVPSLASVGKNMFYLREGETRGFTLPADLYFAAVTIQGSTMIFAEHGIGVV